MSVKSLVVDSPTTPRGLVVAVWFDLVPGEEARFTQAVLENAAASLSEPGCRRFDVCLSPDGRRCFLYEIYDDEPAFAAHKRTPHFLAFDGAVRTAVAEKRVETYLLAANPAAQEIR